MKKNKLRKSLTEIILLYIALVLLIAVIGRLLHQDRCVYINENELKFCFTSIELTIISLYAGAFYSLPVTAVASVVIFALRSILKNRRQ